MRRTWICLPVLLFVLVFSGLGFGQSLAHRRCAAFEKGTNMANWLEAYWELGNGYPRPNKYTRADLVKMREAGLRSLRLPILYVEVVDSVPPYQVDFQKPVFAWVDSVIQWAADLDFKLILDNQHGWDLTNATYQAQIPRMGAMWRQLAQHYSNLDPDRYFFEILNEPPLGWSPAGVEELMSAVIDSIRAVDQTHTLIIDAHSASLGWALASSPVYPDTNLIYTFHSYDPYYFTHQGFSWTTPVQFPTGTPFPLLGDDAQVRLSFSSAANWRDSLNVPVLLGEFGVGIHADATSRCNWVTLVGDLIDQYNYPWLCWDWGEVPPADFSMFSPDIVSEQNMIPCFKDALGVYQGVNVEPQGQADDLRIYPNPVKDEMVLEWAVEAGTTNQQFEGQLINVLGVVVKEIAFRGNRTVVDLRDIPAGEYWLIWDQGQRGVVKFRD